MLNWTPLKSFGTSLGINEWCCWTPTPEIDTNTKTTKLPHTTRQTYGQMDVLTEIWADTLYCHSEDLSPLFVAACATQNYRPCE